MIHLISSAGASKLRMSVRLVLFPYLASTDYVLLISQIPNQYTIRIHNTKYPQLLPEFLRRTEPIIFEDCSMNPQSFSGIAWKEAYPDVPYYSIPLPNPRYLGLHNALGAVLHMSGAAEILDDILGEESLKAAPVVTGHLIAEMLEHRAIRDNLLAAFQALATA